MHPDRPAKEGGPTGERGRPRLRERLAPRGRGGARKISGWRPPHKSGRPGEMHPQPPEVVWFFCEDRAQWERTRRRGHTPAERIRSRTDDDGRRSQTGRQDAASRIPPSSIGCAQEYRSAARCRFESASLFGPALGLAGPRGIVRTPGAVTQARLNARDPSMGFRPRGGT
jgi:hypothetical protein